MNKYFKTFKTYFIITFGLFINTIGWTAFVIPHKIVGGGLSGLSSLINYITGFPIGLGYLIMNIFLILISIKIIGAQFGIKTIYGILGTSAFISVFETVFKTPVLQDEFMSVILGGALIGSGIGIVFSQGGSTGGTDIIAMIITKYKDISPGKLLLMFDVIIISSSYFLFGSVEKIIYGIVTMAVSSYAVDMILEGNKQSAQFFIFSEKYEIIAERISKELARGVTVIKGTGWYTKADKHIVMVIVRKNEIPFVMNIVHQEDNTAFISQGSVMGVYGKGFEEFKKRK